MKYKSSEEFMLALEREIKEKSRGNANYAEDLRKDIALERAMSRFNSGEVSVKGGFGVRTLVPASPFTADIDLLIDKPEWRGMPPDKVYQICTAYVFENVLNDSPDQFQFKPGMSAKVVGLQPDQAVTKVFVQVDLGSGTFAQIQIDAGIKPENLPLEKTSGRNVLAFAEIANPAITTASREYIAADKISMVLENSSGRPRDIVHAALLLDQGKYDQEKLKLWLEKLANYRNVESRLGPGLPAPSSEWLSDIDNQVCRRYLLTINAQDCYDRVNLVLERIYGPEQPHHQSSTGPSS